MLRISKQSLDKFGSHLKPSQELIMGITKFTLVDSPEKMRPQTTGYSIIIPNVKAPVPRKDHNQDEIQTKSSNKNTA